MRLNRKVEVYLKSVLGVNMTKRNRRKIALGWCLVCCMLECELKCCILYCMLKDMTISCGFRGLEMFLCSVIFGGECSGGITHVGVDVDIICSSRSLSFISNHKWTQMFLFVCFFGAFSSCRQTNPDKATGPITLWSTNRAQWSMLPVS